MGKDLATVVAKIEFKMCGGGVYAHMHLRVKSMHINKSAVYASV